MSGEADSQQPTADRGRPDFMAFPNVVKAFERLKKAHSRQPTAPEIWLDRLETKSVFVGGVGPILRLRLHEMSWRDGEAWRFDVVNEHGRSVGHGVAPGRYVDAVHAAAEMASGVFK